MARNAQVGRLIGWSIGIVLVAAALVWGLRPAAITVEAAPVTAGPMRVSIDEDGKTRIRERYIISAPLTGRLMRIQLDPGDLVEPGDTVLAVIEPRHPDLLDSRAQAEADARVRSAKAALGLTGPILDKARATLELAESELTRMRAAAAGNAAARKEVDDAELAARLAREELRAAEFSRQIAEFELQTAQAAASRTRPGDEASDDAAPFVLRSPCRGRVLRVFQESAGVVTAATPLLEIGDPGNLEIVIDVLSTDAVRIGAGDDVAIERWGGAGELRGRVRLVEPAAYTKISALGVEEQRVDVIIDLVDPRERWAALGDGYRVEAAIVVWADEQVLRVPAGALFRQSEDWAVFVINEGRARLRPVRLGQRTALHAQVLEGLTADDVVILHPGDRVTAGDRVEPIGPEVE